MGFLTGKLFGYILAAAALLATGYGFGVKVQGAKTNEVKREFAEYKFTQADYLAKVKNEHSRKEKELRDQLAEKDKEHYAALEKSKADADALRRAVRDGERRLSIRATCPRSPTPGQPSDAVAAGVDDGSSGRADIHPEAAEALVDIAGDADELRQQLIALQAWVKTHEVPTRKAHGGNGGRSDADAAGERKGSVREVAGGSKRVVERLARAKSNLTRLHQSRAGSPGDFHGT